MSVVFCFGPFIRLGRGRFTASQGAPRGVLVGHGAWQFVMIWERVWFQQAGCWQSTQGAVLQAIYYFVRCFFGGLSVPLERGRCTASPKCAQVRAWGSRDPPPTLCPFFTQFVAQALIDVPIIRPLCRICCREESPIPWVGYDVASCKRCCRCNFWFHPQCCASLLAHDCFAWNTILTPTPICDVCAGTDPEHGRLRPVSQMAPGQISKGHPP